MNNYNLLGYFNLARDLYEIDEVSDMNFDRQFLFAITENDKFVLLSESDNENDTKLDEIFSFDIDCSLSKLMLNTVNLSDPRPGIYRYTYSTKGLTKKADSLVL